MTEGVVPAPGVAAIVGAGPAGISTALWLARFRVPLRLLDRATTVGGELLRVNLPIEDYPGLRAADGRAMAARFEEHLHAAGIEPELGVEVRRVDVEGRLLETSVGDVQYDALVLAPGLVRRRLGVPGEDAYRGRGVSYSATTDLAAIAGSVAVVVGGGDGAFENAAILAAVCPSVALVVRGSQPRARPAMRERALKLPNVRLVAETRAVAVEGDGRHVTGLRVAGPAGQSVIPADWIVVKIGFDPATGILADRIEVDRGGFLRVDRGMRTSVPGVFAAGDAANPHAPSIAAAVGDGAIAARGVLEHLRGSMSG